MALKFFEGADYFKWVLRSKVQISVRCRPCEGSTQLPQFRLLKTGSPTSDLRRNLKTGPRTGKCVLTVVSPSLKVRWVRTRYLIAKCTVYDIAASSCREGSVARSCYVPATQLSPRTRTVFCMNPVKEAVVEEGLRCPLLIGCISYQYKVPVY